MPLLQPALLLHTVLDQLWAALLLGQPLLLFGTSSALLTQLALALQSLIAPLEPRLDFRPSLSIYDSDYPALAQAAAAGTPIRAFITTTDPLVAEVLGQQMDVLAVGGSVASLQEYAGSAALKRVVAEAAAGMRTVLVRHGGIRREPWTERFLADLRVVLFAADSGFPHSVASKNVFLRGMLHTQTSSFLAPFQRCLRELRAEIDAEMHRDACERM